ncbi:hypothetical protein MLP_52740 [Microlunatus phosphovorus NM-1]|uniref:Uncharacterized protein n=1 Tax=Microlunatus phosphovorus (strain ATCC 700054 / DSM 10555 / JCM 9379 / NBRC 101784 / NCIMB 13414 / VKM Ac-1990 / NM-1) TaxID=1032480 RepID=F5XIQ0_MICPN|nr:hypothetical protein MLP_52740 [Microlunatus phosphovorus NM-1]
MGRRWPILVGQRSRSEERTHQGRSCDKSASTGSEVVERGLLLRQPAMRLGKNKFEPRIGCVVG